MIAHGHGMKLAWESTSAIRSGLGAVASISPERSILPLWKGRKNILTRHQGGSGCRAAMVEIL